MKKILAVACLLVIASAAPAALITVGSWRPIFKGVELAAGSQQAQTSGEWDEQVLCLRVDLTDPDIVLFTTPKCDTCALETLSENTSHFLQQYGLQAAVNGAFYGSSGGATDTPLGTPDDVYGFALSLGKTVSPANMSAYSAAVLFRTNNQPVFIPTNSPPGTNATGFLTAISGSRPLVINGVNVNNSTPSDLDPRTAVGLSQDRRYLFLLTVDGRQPGWSNGADFHNTGDWLLRFGAWDGINVDGGGSTTMVMADCTGTPVRLNRSSFVAAYGRERVIGHNFGVWARPVPSEVKNLNIQPSTTTATFTWQTDNAATTQVQYGLTTNLGSATPLDSRLKHQHVATLTGLTQGTNYYFRAISTTASTAYTQACIFSTTWSSVTTQVFGFSQVWRYQTNNLNGVNWTAPAYNDAGWLGQGPGLLCVEDSAAVQPKGTALPPPVGASIPVTYYFRTHFNWSGSTSGLTLTLSNYVDDGAVFYLNGGEVYRLRMPAAPTVIYNSTLASTYPCYGLSNSGDAGTNCPDVFQLGGSVLTNLIQGDNVLAAEVHNYATGSKDVAFGTTLLASVPQAITPALLWFQEDGWLTLYWNEEGFTLQQCADLANPGGWTDVPGPVTTSPYSIANPPTRFYRLRR